MRDGLFRKADVAASSGYGAPPGRCEPLVMSGSGACAELLSALSMGHALGPVHEGTLPASRGRCQLLDVLGGTNLWSQSPVFGITCEASLALGYSFLISPPLPLAAVVAPATRPRRPWRFEAARRPRLSSTARAAAPPTASRQL